MGCPGSTEDGCFCGEHHPGLLATSSDPTALEAALAPLRETEARLRIVTPLPPGVVPCTGDPMTCGCERHTGERQERVQGARRRIAQPWEPKPPRHLRAA